MNCFFALNTLKGRVFNHVSFCLYSERLLIISNDVKGSPANKTIGAFGLHTRWYCSHRGSNGMIMSHLQAVVPYGKSQMMQSTLPFGILFIPSRQSSLYILFNSIILILFTLRQIRMILVHNLICTSIFVFANAFKIIQF